jgi:hypothetical protein
VVFSTAFAIGLLTATNNVAAIPARTLQYEQLALDDLALYKKSRSVQDKILYLKDAVSHTQSSWTFHSLTPENYIPTRRLIVRMWARVLRAIEDTYDPTFDPNDPSEAFVISSMPVGCCGIDAKAIEENNRKIARWNQWHELRNVDLRAMGGLRITLESLNSWSPPGIGNDDKALGKIIRGAGITLKRQVEIDAMFSQTLPKSEH